MMKQLLFAMFVINGVGCAVASGPQSSPAPADEAAQDVQRLAASSIAPHVVQCTEDQICESVAICQDDGGVVGGLCNASQGWRCCSDSD